MPGPEGRRPDDRRKKSRELDQELEDSFPASDPPAIIQPVPDDDAPPPERRRETGRPRKRPAG